MSKEPPDLTKLAEKLKAIAQNGLAYCKSPYDKERYDELQHIAAELIVSCSNLAYSDVINIINYDKGYRTPKIDVRGAIFDKNKILLVKETDNLWSLPGGWADVNESPTEMIIREIKEETGYTACVTRFAALWDQHKHDHPGRIPHCYKIVFICDIKDGTFVKNHEISEVQWCDRDNIPSLSLNRITYKQIAKLFVINDDAAHKTEFD